jgi:hypothetical protein
MPYEIIWPLGAKTAFQRALKLRFAFSPEPEIAQTIFQKFSHDLSLLPMEWPTSTLSPKEDIWGCGRYTSIRYKIHYSHQAIEVLEIHVGGSSVTWVSKTEDDAANP